MLNLTLQYIDKSHKHFLSKPLIHFWLKSVQAYLQNTCDMYITIRLVDKNEGQLLNLNYRRKDYATNVLTFVYPNNFNNKEQETIKSIYTDIVLCSPIIEAEAKTEGKALIAHYVHLLIHGMLHAYGYDHETPEENAIMQAIEVNIMAHLGFLNPY
jgi:probable rRNA maturation factor